MAKSTQTNAPHDKSSKLNPINTFTYNLKPMPIYIYITLIHQQKYINYHLSLAHNIFFFLTTKKKRNLLTFLICTMVFPRSLLSKLFIVLILLFTSPSVQVGNAMRPLKAERWMERYALVLQALQQGTVPSSGSNPCTNIPGKGTGTCP